MAYLRFDNELTGIFFATNAYGANSSPEIELIFEKGTARYMDGKLWINGKLLEEDSAPLKGKSYWGAGHERFILDYYDRNMYFTVFDIQSTKDAMFAVYESAAKGGEEVRLSYDRQPF